ncbi:MAG: sensor histidine kinase [Acidithiobacillales bacterium]
MTNEDFSSFRRRESTLIALSLGVLAALVAVHLAFSPMLGIPSRPVLLAIAVFFLLQTAELFWLLSLKEYPEGALGGLYEIGSVWISLFFAFLIGVLGGFEDSHYAVLMLLPIVAAAFRFSRPGIVAVVAAASVLNLIELWLFYRTHPPFRLLEFYEAAVLILMYVVAALVVGYLAGQLRRDQARLRQSLDELGQTRERLVAEEKLAAVGRLASAIAHEIRNPVAMIASSAALMKERAPEDPIREEMGEIVLSEAQRLERLTSDFLTYARLREPEKRATRLADTIGYVSSVARASAASAGVSIESEVHDEAGGGGTALVDPFQIQQALLNLVMNAVEAAPRGTAVRTGLTVDGRGAATLFVENGGGPIPEETSARLFEPFFTRKLGGTGLGLAIARSIARANGGDLVLAENGTDQVRFELTLPAALGADGGA